jgi:hypothetical protein
VGRYTLGYQTYMDFNKIGCEDVEWIQRTQGLAFKSVEELLKAGNLLTR